mgnify:CR=1 FL=1
MSDKKKDPKEVVQYLKNKANHEAEKASAARTKAQVHDAASRAYQDSAYAAEVLVMQETE